MKVFVGAQLVLPERCYLFQALPTNIAPTKAYRGVTGEAGTGESFTHFRSAFSRATTP